MPVIDPDNCGRFPSVPPEVDLTVTRQGPPTSSATGMDAEHITRKIHRKGATREATPRELTISLRNRPSRGPASPPKLQIYLALPAYLPIDSHGTPSRHFLDRWRLSFLGLMIPYTPYPGY
ncbi:hypothetical protein CC1G_13803 [Coprinopsis cinerea okayama7|uniref:Uncharacterized protein n=1 Tax=Coprinopsis cinerea (strain Okayama-7 / 130 / ATCC MYA-4618 / FGSC 9003) TaxID=240176 RepID=D6RKD2_COPC7|nr:hypothetical protein CC1G_13803 [Coprinopsis cinerea okayama7\|eukprot:XP_002912272.1 hypothetical protein CC1G_13803 [Coprinopsis cinerea okayama7\